MAQSCVDSESDEEVICEVDWKSIYELEVSRNNDLMCMITNLRTAMAESRSATLLKQDKCDELIASLHEEVLELKKCVLMGVDNLTDLEWEFEFEKEELLTRYRGFEDENKKRSKELALTERALENALAQIVKEHPSKAKLDNMLSMGRSPKDTSALDTLSLSIHLLDPLKLPFL